VTVGSVTAEVVSARVPAKQLPGVVTLRVRILEGVEPGAAVALSLTAGGATSQTDVTMSEASAVQP